MKINTLVIITVLAFNIYPTASQVGININNPQGVFHIDPKGDTTGSTGLSDDLIVDNTGRVGINTTTPTAKLDVVGTMRIADGSQGNSKVLTSDNNGLGIWKPINYASKIDGTVPATLPRLKGGGPSASNFTYTGANITLPSGQWQIYFYCIYGNENVDYTIWWDLCPQNVWGQAKGRVLSYFVASGSLCPTYASYSVSHSTTTTYYVHGVANTVNPINYHSGARIWAIPVY